MHVIDHDKLYENAISVTIMLKKKLARHKDSVPKIIQGPNGMMPPNQRGISRLNTDETDTCYHVSIYQVDLPNPGDVGFPSVFAINMFCYH